MNAKALPFVLVLLLSAPALRANVLVKGAREIVEAIAKKGGREAAEELAEFGGKKALKEVLEKASREGGEKLVGKVVRYGRRYGLSAVKVIDHSPRLYVKALDDIPKELMERALFAAQRQPAVMTRLLGKHGSGALAVAARHPGIGADIVAKLGDDGLRAAAKISEKQAVVLARHADEIVALPAGQKKQVLAMLAKAPAKVVGFFEKHPKTLLTVAGVTAFIAAKDDIFGSEETVTINPDGSRTVRKVGFIERTTEQFKIPLIVFFLLLGLLLLAKPAIKVWGAYRRERSRVDREEQ